MAAFKAPSEVVFREALPRTATGKVQEFVLRSQLQEASAQRNQIER